MLSGRRLPCGGSTWGVRDNGFPFRALEFYITSFLIKVLGTLRVTSEGPLEHKQPLNRESLCFRLAVTAASTVNWEPRELKSFAPSHVAIQVLSWDEDSLPSLPAQCWIYSAPICRLFPCISLFFMALSLLAASTESTLFTIYLFPNEEMKA